MKSIDEVLEVALERMPESISDEEYHRSHAPERVLADADPSNRLQTH